MAKIVLESSSDVLDNLRARIAADRYWLAGTFAGVVIGAMLPWEQVRIFSVVVGFVFAVLIFMEMAQTIQHQDRWHKARESAYRRQNGLPLPAHEAMNLPLEPETSTPLVKVVHTVTSAGGSQTKAKEYPAENIPPREFIVWLFAGVGSGGRIASERAILDQWSATANVWLETLEDQQILEKIGDYPNAPRRVCAGVTEADALERFGYPPTPPTEQ